MFNDSNGRILLTCLWVDPCMGNAHAFSVFVIGISVIEFCLVIVSCILVITEREAPVNVQEPLSQYSSASRCIILFP